MKGNHFIVSARDSVQFLNNPLAMTGAHDLPHGTLNSGTENASIESGGFCRTDTRSKFPGPTGLLEHLDKPAGKQTDKLHPFFCSKTEYNTSFGQCR